jgi:hypothetical protein
LVLLVEAVAARLEAAQPKFSTTMVVRLQDQQI